MKLLSLFLVAFLAVPQQQGPVFKKLPPFNGEHLPSFAEFRVHDHGLSPAGEIVAVGETFTMLINTNKITRVVPFTDAKGKQYATMVYTDFQTLPFLVRERYEEVKASIRRGQEAAFPAAVSSGK